MRSLYRCSLVLALLAGCGGSPFTRGLRRRRLRPGRRLPLPRRLARGRRLLRRPGPERREQLLVILEHPQRLVAGLAPAVAIRPNRWLAKYSISAVVSTVMLLPTCWGIRLLPAD